MAFHPMSAVPRSVLLKRFSKFSTSGSFVLLCLLDQVTGKKAHIVLENDEWYYYSQEMGIFPFVRREEYILYMVEHATDCFPARTETFQELNRLFSAPEKEEFFEAGRKGVRFLRDTYLERMPWHYGYAIRERHAQDRSFLRVLLELGLVVRRDCESGQRYVETAEVDAHTSAQPGSGDPG